MSTMTIYLTKENWAKPRSGSFWVVDGVIYVIDMVEDRVKTTFPDGKFNLEIVGWRLYLVPYSGPL